MRSWRLSWRLALREMRGGFAEFRVFLASLTLGVAAIAAVGTVSEAVTSALETDATLLLGGDVEVRMVQRFPSAAEVAYLRSNAKALSESIEMRAMARSMRGDGRPAMVELKAVDAAYPLVGHLDVSPTTAPQSLLAFRDGTWGAVVDPALPPKLKVDTGDRVRVGEAEFEIRGTIVREPDRVASIAAFGPRLMISSEALASTGLVQPGSLLRHRTRLLLPVGVAVEPWADAARARFPQAGWQIRGAVDAAPGVERFVDRLAMFLTFAGLTALLIGGLGVANAVRNYLDGRLATIATLKCLGAPGRLVMTTYLTQILILAAVGTFLGLVLGATLPFLLFGTVERLLPVSIPPGPYPVPLFEAAALGLLTALTFSLWPLGRAREVSAASLFRQNVVGASGRPRKTVVAATVLAAASLGGLTIVTTSEPWFGAIFVAGAIVTLVVLRGGAAAVTRAAERMPRVGNAVIRLAVDSLRRPGAPTSMILTSFGAGLTVLVAVSLIDANMRTQISDRLPETVPTFFFIDIQDSQVEAFDATVGSVPDVGTLQRMPALRGRIVRIDGVPVEKATVAPEAAWAIRGDRGITFAPVPSDDTKIVSGAWWPADYSGPPLVSLDAGLARGFGIEVGDTLTVNVLGRDIQARLASTRDIEWRAVPFDFAMVFSPGVFEGAPHTHIAAVYAPPIAEPALEMAVAERFDNVTAIRTREAIETVNGLIDRIGWGVRGAAAVTVFAGAVVLAGAVAADRRRREYEAVLLKVLGATRGRIALIYLAEYGLLGMVTALIAAALGTAVAWGVVTLLMDFDWTFRSEVILITIAMCTTLTLVFGFIGTWRQLSHKAAGFLRND